MSNQLSIKQVLDTKGFFMITTAGVSMKPLFRDRCDRSVIVKVTKPIKKYDVVLYTRENDLVLHRVLKLDGDTLIIRGDNCNNLEYVKKEQVIGILSEFYRGQKHYTVKNFWYKLYSRIWVSTHSVRHLVRKIKSKIAVFLRRGKRKNG